jgi:hypothetical protein
MKTSTLLKTSTGIACSLALVSFLSSSALSLSASSNPDSPKSNLTNSSEKFPNITPNKKQLSPPTTPSIISATDSVNLNGKWRGNDGATYYIRRVGNRVWWYGEKSPTNPNFSNVFRAAFSGSIKTGSTVVGEWADVPKGTILNSGTLSFKVINPNFLQRTTQTGNFGGSTWTRI